MQNENKLLNGKLSVIEQTYTSKAEVEGFKMKELEKSMALLSTQCDKKDTEIECMAG